MQFFQLLALAMASVSAAKGEDNSTGNKTMSTHAQCNKMAELQALVNVAANATELTKISHNNATKASTIKAKASTAATTLKTMESNTTLVTACKAQFAVEKMAMSCAQISEYEMLKAVVANSTKLSRITKNNATKATVLEAKVSSLATKVSTLESNKTLTTFCAGQQTKKECSSITAMQKSIADAANTTFLEDKFKNNTDKITAFKAQAAKAQTKLQALQSNTTLTTACANIEKSTTGNATTSSTSSTSAKSAAGAVRPVDGAVSLVCLFFAGILLL